MQSFISGTAVYRAYAVCENPRMIFAKPARSAARIRWTLLCTETHVYACVYDLAATKLTRRVELEILVEVRRRQRTL